jgi:non-homologous end joining protein Ku
MAPRANWKGYLKLSLVSCAVALFPATTTRNRGHYQVVDADTGEEVPQEDQVKGYQVDRDSHVLMDALRRSVQSERRGSSSDTRRSNGANARRPDARP